MNFLKLLQDNIVLFMSVILTVVIGSIILAKFQDTSAVSDINISGANPVNTSINTAISGFQEPANWVSIVVIATVGIGVLSLFLYLMKKN